MAEKVADLYAALGVKIDEGAFARANKLLGAVKGAVVAFLGFKAVQGVIGIFEDVVETGGKFADAAQKTGVAADQLQAYSFAAGLAGADSDKLIGSLGKLNKGLAELAKTGKGPVADGLQALGISLQDPAVKAGNLDEILLEVADKFQKMPDGPKKVAAAMNLFGKTGADLIPLLNQGGDALNALKKEAIDLGVVIDNDMVNSIDGLGDDIDRVKAGWQGMKNQAVAAIVPLIADLMPDLIAAMKDAVAWVKSHKTEIQAAFYATGKTIKTVVEILIGLGRVIKEIVEFFVWLVTNIVKGLASIGRFLGRTARAIVEAFKSAFRFIVDGAKSVVKFFVDVGRDIVDTFVRVGVGIKDAFAAAWQAIKQGAKDAASYIGSLPVIKQLGDLGRFIGGKAAGGGGARIRISTPDGETHEFDSEQEAQDWQRQQRQAPPPPPPPSVPPAGTAVPGAVSVSMPITVNPSPGMNETELGNKVGKAVDERLSSVFRHVANTEGIA